MPHAILIHGTWGRGSEWGELRTELERRGWTVHTPDLRYHDLPAMEGSLLVGRVSLRDYVADLVSLAEALDTPPLIVGSSMGGLLAQLVAARTPNRGLILFAPAPAAGMFPFYPTMLRIFIRHFLQRAPWRRPMPPRWETWRWGVVNEQDEQFALDFYKLLTYESGRAYWEMAFWFLDPGRASRVETRAINSPVLVFAGSEDRVVVPRISRLTAARYPQSRFIQLAGCDHIMFAGRYLPDTMRHIDGWMREHELEPRPRTATTH